uniref:Aa_trans domain-containing protein n=1 Tax=Toxocara canis TaxID=6265 RepID=A0A183V5S0_TOXCA
LYMPLSVFAYVVYGSSMHSSVIDSIQTPWIRYTADLAIALHCLLALLITINPINQQIENIFNVPHVFCLKRVIVRTVDLAVVLFVAVSIPDFTPIMNLFGSTTIPLSCITLPTVFNLWLNAATFDEKANEWIKPTIKQRCPLLSIHLICGDVYNWKFTVVTVVCAVVGCYMAITDFAFATFTPPCYVRPFLNKDYSEGIGKEINCCGRYRNILAHGNISTCYNPLQPSTNLYDSSQFVY